MTKISKHCIEVVYSRILTNEPIGQKGVIKATPEYCSTTIQKCCSVLVKQGRIKKDNDWPPRYTVVRDEKSVD